MLKLSRYAGEAIQIGDHIRLLVQAHDLQSVSFCISRTDSSTVADRVVTVELGEWLRIDTHISVRVPEIKGKQVRME